MDEDILWFEISVDELFSVKILKAKNDLRGVESSQMHIQTTMSLDDLEQLSTLNILHLDVKRARVLLNAQHIDLKCESKICEDYELRLLTMKGC